MAEFLVKAIDAVHADPGKDKQGCYKRGDVVVIMPDSHTWGREEHPQTTTHRPPKFVIIKIPGLAVDVARKYIESEFDATGDNIITRRKFKLLVDNVPQTVKGQLKAKGEVTVNWNQIRAYIKNKITGVTE